MVNDEGGKTACSDATCLHKETHLASELKTGLIVTGIGEANQLTCVLTTAKKENLRKAII